MKILKAVAAAGLGLMLTACVPEFENALDSGPAADPALIGTWDGKSDVDTDVMRLTITKSGDELHLLMTDPTGGSDEKIVLVGRTAEVQGVRYLSVTPQDAELLGAGEEKVGYYILRYAPEGAAIKVWSLDMSKLSAAVEADRLKGEVTGSGSKRAIKVSATSAELAAFFATDEGRTVFNEQGPGAVLTLTRVSP